MRKLLFAVIPCGMRFLKMHPELIGINRQNEQLS